MTARVAAAWPAVLAVASGFEIPNERHDWLTSTNTYPERMVRLRTHSVAPAIRGNASASELDSALATHRAERSNRKEKKQCLLNIVGVLGLAEP